MTTSNGRSTESRRTGRSPGQWLLGLLIILALAASILMVFTDQLSIAGSLAVIAALWAAVIGAILVTKFRRQAEGAEAKSRDLRLVYELQLEREIAARRQYELDIESTIRKEVSAETSEELIALKEQIASLRSSLEILLGESLPDQRVALPNEKLRELASGLERGPLSSEPIAPDDGMLAARDFAATAPAPSAGRHEPSSIDPNELTEVIPIITDEDPVSGRIATVYEQSDYEPPTYAAQSFEPQSLESQSFEPQSFESRTYEAEVFDAPSFGTQSFSTPSYGTPSYDAQSFGTETFEPQSAESQSFEPQSAESQSFDAPRESSGDEMPTTVADAAAETYAAQDASFAEVDAPVDAPVVDEDETADTAVDTPGRHEGAGEVASTFAGRRRRRADDDEASHSSGLPVSELLSQLRDAGAPAGRRRRAD